MRTKTLLVACAALALTYATSQAQPVYSANVVGYVNLTLTNGFNMISNPLDLDGTGTNNTLQTVLGTQLPGGSTVFPFVNGAYDPTPSVFSHNAWSGDTNAANLALNPGRGVFVLVAGSSPVTVTVVGQVLQGSLSHPFSNGYNIISSQIPLAGGMQTYLSYPPTAGDTVFAWNSTTQAYPVSPSVFSHNAWTGGEPQLTVGQAVMLLATAPSGGVWSTNFTVQ
ncbi:MAG: hypothetical protein ABSA45_08810 [Verrucomicrobiota bacterium]